LTSTILEKHVSGISFIVLKEFSWPANSRDTSSWLQFRTRLRLHASPNGSRCFHVSFGPRRFAGKFRRMSAVVIFRAPWRHHPITILPPNCSLKKSMASGWANCSIRRHFVSDWYIIYWNIFQCYITVYPNNTSFVYIWFTASV
jgi:hypothetical protein